MSRPDPAINLAGDVFSRAVTSGPGLGIAAPADLDQRLLGKISKRGNRYVRVLFARAASGVLIRPERWERYGLKFWIEAAKKR